MTHGALIDSHDRRVSYLRWSVTDHCQFRCVYCMPPEGIEHLPQADYMTPGEMESFVAAMADLGVWRVRLTGGEPLLRKDIVSIVERLARIPGVRDLALTTNGELLTPLLPDLKRAGLKRVNISLDSLNPERFRRITLSDSYEKVRSSINNALDAGLEVKVNAVAMRGITHEEIDGFANLAFHNPLEVRFIEFMPLCGTGWRPDLTLPIEDIRSRVKSQFRLISTERGSEVAESYQIAGGRGRIGFIASMTEPFCSGCSRIRITATGKIQLCLFSNVTYDILPELRSGASMAEIQQSVRNATLRKPASHPWANGETAADPGANAMIRTIGG